MNTIEDKWKKFIIFNELEDINLQMNQFKDLVRTLRSISSVHGLGKKQSF